MEYDLDELDKLAKKTLSDKRYDHTRCVVEQARKLAVLYGCNEHKAMVAAWLHDICKEMNPQEQLQWISEFGIILDSIQQTQPMIWHGMAACGYMKCSLGITDEEILNAVRYHTTARGKMTRLDEVIYLADLTSADRNYPDVQYMRKLAQTAIGLAMKYAMKYAVNDLVEHSQGICQDSLEAYHFYLKY